MTDWQDSQLHITTLGDSSQVNKKIEWDFEQLTHTHEYHIKLFEKFFTAVRKIPNKKLNIANFKLYVCFIQI